MEPPGSEAAYPRLGATSGEGMLEGGWRSGSGLETWRGKGSWVSSCRDVLRMGVPKVERLELARLAEKGGGEFVVSDREPWRDEIPEKGEAGLVSPCWVRVRAGGQGWGWIPGRELRGFLPWENRELLHTACDGEEDKPGGGAGGAAGGEVGWGPCPFTPKRTGSPWAAVALGCVIWDGRNARGETGRSDSSHS